MKQDLKIELLGLLKILANPPKTPVSGARMLARILCEYGDKKTAAEVHKQYGTLVTDSQTIQPVVADKPAKARKVRTPNPVKEEAPAGLFTCLVCPQGTKVRAVQEAREFTNPQVFLYRSSMLPTPGNFGVKVEIKSASPVKVQYNDSYRYPYAVLLTVQVDGAPEAVQKWTQSFYDRTRTYRLPDGATVIPDGQ